MRVWITRWILDLGNILSRQLLDDLRDHTGLLTNLLRALLNLKVSPLWELLGWCINLRDILR